MHHSTDRSSYATREDLFRGLKTYGLNGPQETSDRHRGDPMKKWIFWQRIDTPNVCLCNDRLQFTVTVYEMSLGNDVHRTMAFEITGEYRPNTWTKLQSYSVPWEQGMGSPTS